MAVAIGLWSQKLTPGKAEVIVPQADLRITNVALGEEVADASGRTTVKFSYSSIPSHVDSDDDEEGDDEDEVAPAASTTILCSLTAGMIEHALTDITLEQDEEYTFELVGKNPIYLTGNYVDQTPFNDPPFADDSDDDSEGYDLRDVSSDVEVEGMDLDTDASRFEEVEEAAPSLKRRKEAKQKLKAEGGKAVPVVSEEKTEAKKEKKDKKKAENIEEKKADNIEEKKVKPIEKELAGGVKILDTKVGTGPMAKKGNTILMRYIGKLTDGSIFDSNTKGKPFTFRLGAGEVIKGWDEGVAGMQVGGERKLTVPPKMGYGKKPSGPIPPNSTLIFEVKLMQIK
ncbi:hypothetical protein BD779DRAFT_1504605 [Infundibulicybe gibba]|nr:hypothetical protein BD779DRAFT_1504605 [Infundibulicybe gibba]